MKEQSQAKREQKKKKKHVEFFRAPNNKVDRMGLTTYF